MSILHFLKVVNGCFCKGVPTIKQSSVNYGGQVTACSYHINAFRMVFAKVLYCVTVGAIIGNCAAAKPLVSKVGRCDAVRTWHVRHKQAKQTEIKICFHPAVIGCCGNRPHCTIPDTLVSWVQIYVLPHFRHRLSRMLFRQ